MGGNSIQQTYTNANPAPWSLQEGQPTPTPTPTPTAEPTLQPGWHEGLYEYTGAQPHAVTRVERGENEDTYTYDANGNMLTRVEGEVTWTQTYNAENRLSSVSDGIETWTFTYDGDGRRVRQTGPTGEVTLYLGGGVYEVRDAAGDAEVVKYYGIAGQRVAMQDHEGVKYLLTDHLGSVSAVLDDEGNLLSEQRYTPFGEQRFEVGITETDFGFTGQRALAGTGLVDYNARFYAPGLGRWTQPDSMVPDGPASQALGRFSYVFNSPLVFTDPTGNVVDWGCVICDRIWFDYSSTQGALNSTIEFVASIGCFFLSCNLDTEADRVDGPTRAQYDQQMAAGLTDLANPIGMVANIPGRLIASGTAREVVEQAVEHGLSANRVSQVADTFGLEAQLYRLTDPIPAYRWFSNPARQTGAWYSLERYSDPRRMLALPESNLATRLTISEIQPGAHIIIGQARSMVGESGFGAYATGGGTQIYVIQQRLIRVLGVVMPE